MSAPANWILGPDLREATVAAFRVWLAEHPHRKRPTHCTPDEELRDYAWELHRVPIASVAFVAEAAVERARGHWPKLAEVRAEVSAFVKRHNLGAPLVPRSAAAPVLDVDSLATVRAQNAQAAIMLETLGLDGPEVSRASQSIAIASVTEALLVRLTRAVRAGKLPRERLAEFREGRYPTPDALRAVVADIAAAGAAELSGAGRVLLASMLERVEVSA